MIRFESSCFLPPLFVLNWLLASVQCNAMQCYDWPHICFELMSPSHCVSMNLSHSCHGRIHLCESIKGL